MPDFPSPPLSARARRTLAHATEAEAAGDGAGAYRLLGEETVADGIRRVAAAQLADAVERLRDPDRDRGEAVHEARKDLKKARAVLRLVRDRLGDDLYKAENRRLRDAGRELSDLRDAEVKLETLAALGERFGAAAPAAAIDDLAAELRRELDELAGAGDDRGDAEAGERATAAIEASRAAVADWPLDGKGWKLVKGGLERSYERGREAFRDTVASPTPANVHEWRKRVKDLWYHLRLIRDAWPDVVGELADAAHELADYLGDHHDLEVLAGDVGAREGIAAGDGERAILLELIERRQDELLEAAVPVGERLYAEPPKEFKRRVRAYWRAWRSD
jgi:CHAD domain-containing protein